MRPSQHYDADQSVSQSHWHTLVTLAKYLWPKDDTKTKVRIVASLTCLLAAKIATVVVPYIYKLAVDALNPQNNVIALPVGIIVAYGVARLSTAAFGEIRDIIFVPVSQQARRALALKSFQHLHGMSLRFHLDRQTGGLSRVIERALGGMRFVLSFMLFNILPTFIELGFVVGILLFNFDWRYAAVTLGGVVIYVFMTASITEWRLKYRREMNSQDSLANTRAIDSLINYETVKYFNNEEHEYRRYDESLKKFEDAAVTNQQSLGFLNFSQQAVMGLSMLAVMYLSAKGVQDKVLTVGDFVMANTYMMQLFRPLGFLGFVYREMKQSFVDMDKMFELLDVKPEVVDAPDAKDLKPSGGGIIFENVSFSYDGKRPILKDVSFEVAAGKTVAVVGPSGSGKSTIARLLYRFYDVQKGRVLVDGQDIKQVKGSTLRQAIGIVPQDTVLFNDSIYYNLEYGKPGSPDSAIKEAAAKAKLDRFIESLPDKFDSKVGERGLKLSGGEKQRVAIARAILKDPLIMLFDEATSALDTKTEHEIQASLEEVAKKSTTLVIAHRLSTIKDADQILVLMDGKIVERGTHDDLLAQNGDYASMWNRQQQRSQLESELARCTEEA